MSIAVGAPLFKPHETWPHVGRQWPAYNVESDQADGLAMWMPWGGGSVPKSSHHIDLVSGLIFTKSGTPVWMFDSERGWVMSFDRASSEGLISATIPLAEPFTLCCWGKSSDVTNEQVAMSIGDTNGADYHSLRLRPNEPGDPIGAVTFDGTGAAAANTTIAYTVNTWHHLCAVFAAANDRAVYIDGGGKGTDANARTVTSADRISIGVSADSTPFGYMDGYIMDARVYNIAKTDAEVQQMATEPWELFQLPRRLWRLGAIAPPPAGQPIHLRALTIPHMRQWQPRIAS